MTNAYRALADLLPDPPLTTATVTATHTDGTATITAPGGGTQRVRGSATEGQTVFVRDGLIQGPAPDLPIINIEI